MSLFLRGMGIAGLEYPDNAFFKIPRTVSFYISLSIFGLIFSFTEKGLMKKGFLSSISSSTCIFGARPISSRRENTSLYSVSKS